MSFLLDTDICSAFFKKNAPVVLHVMLHYGGLHVSAVTVGELMTWARRATTSVSRVREIENFLGTAAVIDIDRVVAEAFGQIRAALLDRG